LKRSISHGLFDHIIRCNSAHEIWRTLDGLFNKKDEARLQILENELANTTQGNLSISEYFLKIKNLCSEISLLNPEEAISEARIGRIIIRGLKREYIPYVTSIQGWVQQPSLEEFENLLSSQESLAKQMTSVSIKEGEGSALMARQKFVKNKGNRNSSLAHMTKATPVRVEYMVSLLTLPPIKRFSNAIGVAKLGISKDFAESNYERAM